MGNLQKNIEDLSQRKITRQQFFMMIGGSLLGMIGFFRLLQAMSTPDENDLSRADKGLFGEREYGHTPNEQPAKVTKKNFNEDAFG